MSHFYHEIRQCSSKSYPGIQDEIYGRKIPTAVYLILSVLITFLFVMILYHPLQKLFVRDGKIIISEDTLTVVTHHKNKVLHFDELEDVCITRISLYGSSFDQMTISGNKGRIRLYSDENGSSASGREDDYSFRMISRIISERIQAKE